MYRQLRVRSDGSSTQCLGIDKTIAVLTSGGDAQGMNAAVRAVVRMGIHCSSDIYVIQEGYAGLIDGGDKIKQTKWQEVSGIIQLGGTVIGSARCKAFMKRDGRRTACHNLIQKRISHLCVIGGDGSLTGANLLREEWPELVSELYKSAKISKNEYEEFKILHIVGIVGSIDNDFCGTDMTIGADSALHRIIDCVDSISTTAHSHQRTFVLEVMGRNCGYLALCAAIACDADWVFIPEDPPMPGWEDQMCSKLESSRKFGNRLNIIIIAEGARDRNGQPITTDYIKDICINRLTLDTRITVLGHVQRGGCPSAFDRILGTRMGCEAVLALLEAGDDTPAYVIALKGNQMIRIAMMKAVTQTKEVEKAMANKDWDLAVKLRGRTFERNIRLYRELGANTPIVPITDIKGIKVGIVNIGAPAGGTNAAIRAVVRNCINHNVTPIVIKDGIGGFLHPNSMQEYKWWDVRNFTQHGGTNIGTSRKLPSDVGTKNVIRSITAQGLSGLIIIGGYESCTSARELINAGCSIPVIIIPATISNNVPGTEFTIGVDTSLNAVVDACDRIKTSATGTQRRVFIVETMGGYCGYLAAMAGLASGADSVYINEQPQSINDISQNVFHLIKKIKGPIKRGIVIQNEKASSNYTTQFLHSLYSEEGAGVFDTRTITLGHIQQGGAPSPFDRSYATKCGSIASSEIIKIINENWNEEKQICDTKGISKCQLLGINRRKMTFHNLEDLSKITDEKKRRPVCKEQWWLNLVPMQRIMAHYNDIDYITEVNENSDAPTLRLLSHSASIDYTDDNPTWIGSDYG